MKSNNSMLLSMLLRNNAVVRVERYRFCVAPRAGNRECMLIVGMWSVLSTDTTAIIAKSSPASPMGLMEVPAVRTAIANEMNRKEDHNDVKAQSQVSSEHSLPRDKDPEELAEAEAEVGLTESEWSVPENQARFLQYTAKPASTEAEWLAQYNSSRESIETSEKKESVEQNKNNERTIGKNGTLVGEREMVKTVELDEKNNETVEKKNEAVEESKDKLPISIVDFSTPTQNVTFRKIAKETSDMTAVEEKAKPVKKETTKPAQIPIVPASIQNNLLTGNQPATPAQKAFSEVLHAKSKRGHKFNPKKIVVEEPMTQADSQPKNNDVEDQGALEKATPENEKKRLKLDAAIKVADEPLLLPTLLAAVKQESIQKTPIKTSEITTVIESDSSRNCTRALQKMLFTCAIDYAEW